MSGKAQNTQCGEPRKCFATQHGARMQDGKWSSYCFLVTKAQERPESRHPLWSINDFKFSFKFGT
jgi:hypothetical protein